MPATVEVPPPTSLAAIHDPKTRRVSVRTRPTPTPTGTQVLVKVDCAGVCASDLHFTRLDLPYLQPTVSVAGHEGVGRVVALGPDADPAVWRRGDRVAIRWLHSVCKACEVCTTGYENLCPHRRVSGKDVEGCFADYAVADSAYLCRVPERVGDAEAAPILCAGVTVYKALRVAELKRGHLAIQYARAMGYRPLALDAGKEQLCGEVGAEVYVDVSKTEDCVAEVVRATGGGAHCALVCASSAEAYADAVKYLRRAGKMVCVGVHVARSYIPVMPDDFVARGIRIMGSSTGTLQDTAEALGFLERGEVKTHVTERALNELEDVFEKMEAGKLLGRAVLRIH